VVPLDQHDAHTLDAHTLDALLKEGFLGRVLGQYEMGLEEGLGSVEQDGIGPMKMIKENGHNLGVGYVEEGTATIQDSY